MPKLPAVMPTEARVFPSRASVSGDRVMILMVPPVAPPPYMTAPLPRMISMRSMVFSGMEDQRMAVASISFKR